MRFIEDDQPRWILGYIDSYGAVHARIIPNRETACHTCEERLAGRSWKWSIQSQEFFSTLEDMRGSTNRLSQDDLIIVIDWLEREGYKDSA